MWRGAGVCCASCARPTDLGPTEHMLRSVANRIGGAMIVVGAPDRLGVDGAVDHTVSLVGVCLSAALGLYPFWRIVRTPGDL